jgi:hypothetical protein
MDFEKLANGFKHVILILMPSANEQNQDLRDARLTANLPDWTAERKFYGRFYLSQGYNTPDAATNDCGPTSLAMVLNLLLFQANLGTSPLGKNAVIRSSGLTPLDRVPAWVPRYGGATAPWGLVKAFNRWAEKFDLGWRAERRSKARRAHVIEQLVTGRPVTALKIWGNGGAHWVNLVRYASEKDKVYFLDPNPWFEHLPEDKRIQSQTWAAFDEDWSRISWWSRLLGIQNEIILYSRSS